MRWQSTVDNTEIPKRERFATPLSVLGIFCSFILVLVLLYPEQGLLGVLSGGDDAATIRYREALLRIRPDDNDLRLKVTGSLVRSGSYNRALEVLSIFKPGLSSDQQHLIRDLRYTVLKNLYSRAIRGESEWLRLQPLFLAAARDLAGSDPPAWLLKEFAADARKAGDQKAGQEFDRQAKASINNQQLQASVKMDYRATAAQYFEMMKGAEGLARRRELFFSGVRTLQAGNLPQEAFDAGEKYLNGLASDRATLIFLTKVGLAAGQPARAQRIIKKALGMNENKQKQGDS